MGTMQVLGGLIRKALVGVKMVGLSGAPDFLGSPVHHPFYSGTNPREMTLHGFDILACNICLLQWLTSSQQLYLALGWNQDRLNRSQRDWT